MEHNTVLVVEDDEDIRESLQLVFEEGGYDVVTAGDGQEALDLIQVLPDPTVILLDLHMPRLDGYNVVRYLANHPQQRQGHPIFLLTGDMRQLSPEMAQVLGSEGVPVLPKPFDVEDLQAQVHSAFLRLEEQRESCSGVGLVVQSSSGGIRSVVQSDVVGNAIPGNELG